MNNSKEEEMTKTEKWQREILENARYDESELGLNWSVEDLIENIHCWKVEWEKEERERIVRKLEAIVERNTDKEFGTDYDGLAEGVLVWLAEQRKKK